MMIMGARENILHLDMGNHVEQNFRKHAAWYDDTSARTFPWVEGFENIDVRMQKMWS